MQQFKNSLSNPANQAKQESDIALPPQSVIEERMQEIIYLGNYEAAFLFNYEGLPLAQASNRSNVDQAGMVEISLMLKQVQQVANSVADINGLKEIIIEGLNKRKVVFRFFQLFEQTTILAVVVTPRRSYRDLTNRLVKVVKKVMSE